MSYSETISNLIENLFENSKRASSRLLFKSEVSSKDIKELASDIIDSGNNIARVQSAKEFFSIINNLGDCEFKKLMLHLRDDRDINIEKAKLAVKAYDDDKSEKNYIALQKANVSERKILFRKLNSFDESTTHLVKLRERILSSSSKNQNYNKVDNDLKTLFFDWFNRGFLVLKPIDWNTPAAILEKIIKYESVHQINSWRELRDRINSLDRKCFAFFHPAMGNEPLIFVEIAFTSELPKNINQILNTTRSTNNINKLNKAIFYSISNCQRGLDGISFGNYLIKDVIEKPSIASAPSNKAVIGRYILPKKIFSKLSKQKPGKGGEIHITDAIQSLIYEKNKFVAHTFSGKYLDCGSMSGYIKSGIEISKL